MKVWSDMRQSLVSFELDSNLSQRNSRLQAAVKLGVTLRLEKTEWVVPRVSRDESSALVRSLIASGSKA